MDQSAMDPMMDDSFALEANLHGVTGSVLRSPGVAFVGSECDAFSSGNSPASLYYSSTEEPHLTADHYDVVDNKSADQYVNPWLSNDLDSFNNQDAAELNSLEDDSWLNDSALLETIFNHSSMAEVSNSQNVSATEIFEEIYRECEALSPTGQSSPECPVDPPSFQLPVDCQFLVILPPGAQVLSPAELQQPQVVSDHNFYGKSRPKTRPIRPEVVSPAGTVGSSQSGGDDSIGPVKPARKERKKVQNRTAAYRYRLKKRQEKEGRQVEISFLQSTNTRLKAEAEDIQREIGYLKALMSEMFSKAK